MSRKWFTMLFLVAAAACGGDAADDELELDEGLDTQEETLPATPVEPLDTMMMDTMDMGEDTLGM